MGNEPLTLMTEEEVEKFLALEPTSEHEKQEISLIARGQDALQVPQSLIDEPSVEPQSATHAHPQTPRAMYPEGDDSPLQISKLLLPEKIKLAMFGNSVARGLLIRDANRMVQLFVLKNPRIQLNEVEEFARNPNLSEHVLRHISGVQAWTKSYTVKLNLVFNPKTPSDLALRWVQYLNNSDLKKLAKSRNVPQVLVTVARRKLEEIKQS